MKVSIICPFYNESLIIEKAVHKMIEILKEFEFDWELILVNDGSTDDSDELVRKVTESEPKVQVISYQKNQGRGYALKTGIDNAIGDIIITTEIDLSWGDSIVQDIVDKFLSEPHLDAVIASPNLPGGGYKNVPLKRVLISRFGNYLIRILFSNQFTMNTGMTRGYKRDIIQTLQFDEKGKEFHLEVLLKLVVINCSIGEIPAQLEWLDHKLAKRPKAKRKSSSNILKLILTHLNFAVFARPIRYFWAFSFICILSSFVFFGNAIIRILNDETSIYYGIVGMFLAVFSLLFLGFGILSEQNLKILKEMWQKNRSAG